MIVSWLRCGGEVQVMTDDGFRYLWTEGTLTVNVSRRLVEGVRLGGLAFPAEVWVNFDAFTMGDVPDLGAYVQAVRAWHDEHVGPDAPDARYVADNPTREYLMGGA